MIKDIGSLVYNFVIKQSLTVPKERTKSDVRSPETGDSMDDMLARLEEGNDKEPLRRSESLYLNGMVKP